MSLGRNVALTGALVIGLGVMATLGGCNIAAIGAGSQTYDETQTFEGANVKRVSIDARSVDVHLTKSADDQVSVHFYGKGREDFYELVAEQNGDLMNVAIEHPDGVTFGWFGTTSLDLDIALPEKVYEELVFNGSSGDVEFGSLKADKMVVDLSSGDLSFDGWQGKMLKIDSSSGGMKINDLQASDRIEVQASSGDIRVDGVKANRFQAGANSGRLELSGVESDEVVAETSSGDITIRTGDKMPKRVQAEASSGRVELYLPQTAAFDFDVNVSSGSVDIDFSDVKYEQDEEKYKKGSVNGGGAQVELDTSSGDVRLMRN